MQVSLPQTVSVTAAASRSLLFDSAALRRIEANAAAALGNDFELMRRAGRAAWRCALRHWPQAQRIVVVCGPGNNAGDGYVFARHAHDSGRTVHVVQGAEGEPRSDVARRALATCRERGVDIGTFPGSLPAADLIVDALFGIGLDRVPDAAISGLIDAVNAHMAPCLSLDVPSGVIADHGSAPGAAVVATRTLEFIAAKAGLRSGPALDRAGALELATLDLPPSAFDGVAASAQLLTPAQLKRWLTPRVLDSHKGAFGRVLCVGGDHGAGGAIMLCAEAALRSGAGLVDVATRQAHLAPLLARRPEVMSHAVEQIADIAALFEHVDVVALGPGLGQEQWGRLLFAAALSAGKPLVIDADGLNLLARRPHELPSGSILTPHPGEAARLLGSTTAQVQADRFAAARALCQRFGCVVVLKGAGSIVATPRGEMRVIGAGNPGMASGGMGDLLTGVIAGLRGQGLAALEAASAGTLLHAAAGDQVAAEHGQRGLLASDLLGCLQRLSNPERTA